MDGRMYMSMDGHGDRVD